MNDDRAKRLTQLRQAYESGILDEDTYRAAIAALDAQPGSQIEVTGAGAVAQPGGVAAGASGLAAGGDVVGRDKVVGGDEIKVGDVGPGATVAAGEGAVVADQVGGHVIVAGPGAQVTIGERPTTCAPLDDASALTRCLRHIVESNRRLQLQGIRSAGGLVSIELEEIYVTLNATVQKTVAAEEAWVEDLARLAPGEAKRAELARPRETVQQAKVKVQEALAMYPRLVVLGDPGSGKTTLLRYLALTFARNLLGEEGLVAQRLQLRVRPPVQQERQEVGSESEWPEERRLPILLPLRDFARFLETEHPDIGADGPKLLLDYLRTYFANQEIVLPERFFADRLGRGECAVLLDGVDEVAAFAARQRVARIIEKFTLAYPDNRYVVTSRVVGYTGGARLGADYAITTIRDFTQADVERFAAFWNRAVEVALAGEETPYVLREAER